MNEIQRPTWAEIDLDALAFNFHSVKTFIGPDVRMMAVVKADAYGHGAVECARRLEREGIDWFGVALPQEGVELRKAGIRKLILCLGGFWPGQEEMLLDNLVTPAVFDAGRATLFDRAAMRRGTVADIHVKIDTGMGRVGLRIDELERFLDKLSVMKNLRVAGLMTHFAVADRASENEFTARQIELFELSLAKFRARGFNPIYLDLANSPGAVAHPASHGNLVRVGGILYGLGDDVLPPEAEKPDLKPVMALRTQIAHLKRVPRGETLGYGRTFVCGRDSVIATLPIGYQDGLPRLLSNNGEVIVRGTRAPIAGRVSMDWTIVDVTDVPDVSLGDEVTVFGVAGADRIKAESVARASGTISYEITCGISRRVPRVYVEGHEKRLD
jgi:alanine racemase